MNNKQTYLNWYKQRMNALIDPNNFSLMSSSIREPWHLLTKQQKETGKKAFQRIFMKSNAYGLPALIERISSTYRVPENKILTTQGVTSALFLLSSAFAQNGRHVVVERPGYEPLWQAPVQCGAKVDFFRRQDDGSIDMEDLQRVLTPETHLVIITNLHNPTGFLLSDQEISDMLDYILTISPKALLVVDEIYRDFIPETPKPAYLISDRIISINSLTKVYGLSVLRCGWIFAAPEHIERLRNVQVLMSGIGSRYLEALSTLVFDHRDAYLKRARTITGTNRRILQDSFKPLFESKLLSGTIPRWGCISFLRINNVSNVRILTDYFESKMGLYCAPGDFFGAPDHVRIGIGEITPKRLKEALILFKSGLQSFIDQGLHHK